MEENNQQLDAEAIRKNKIKFLFIVALFVFPIATALYLNLTGWRPGSTINHGTLVQPVRPAPSMVFRSPSKEKFTQKILEKKWNIVVATNGPCDKNCQSNLASMRQIHIGQGKYEHRIRRILINSGQDAGVNHLKKTNPKLIILKVDQANEKVFLNWVTTKDQKSKLMGVRVFLIDPRGNYLMYYPEGSDPAKMRKDLSRLLRVSRIG